MSKINISGTPDLDAVRIKRGGEQSRVEGAREGTQVSPNASAASANDDAVRVSDQGAAVGRLTRAVSELPDVRTERVKELQSRIQSGNYNPDASDIADAIVKSDF